METGEMEKGQKRISSKKTNLNALVNVLVKGESLKIMSFNWGRGSVTVQRKSQKCKTLHSVCLARV